MKKNVKKPKLEVIRIVEKQDCYCCNHSINGEKMPRKGCKACGGDGDYKETRYIFILGNIAFDGDTVK